MLLKSILLALGLIGTASTALADASATALADLLLRKSGGPGVAVALLRDGQIEIAARGLRAKGQPDAVTPDDLWHIGSDAKSMTATLVARLAERGVIHWDDTLGDILGAVIPDIPPALAKATYADLLDHRANLTKNIPPEMEEEMWAPLDSRDIIADRLRYASYILHQGALTDGPATYAYSNAGYVIAGAMLEHTTGQRWEDLMTAEVFTPLGMTSAGFGAPPAGNPWGHFNPLMGSMRPMPPGVKGDNPPVFGPAGTVHMSARDLLTYLRAHLEMPGSFLPPDSWQRLHSPRPGATYVSGWVIGANGALAHDGSNTLWFTRVIADPTRNRALVLMINAGGDFWTHRALERVTAQFFQD